MRSSSVKGLTKDYQRQLAFFSFDDGKEYSCVDHWTPCTSRKEKAQEYGDEVGGSEVVGGLLHHHHHYHRLANPAGLLRRTPVSTQTPCRAGRTPHGKVPPKSSQILQDSEVRCRRRFSLAIFMKSALYLVNMCACPAIS